MRHRSGSLPSLLRLALASARRHKRLSQAQLGNRVSLPQAHISGIETGRIVPRYDTLLDLVRVLDHDLVLVPRHLVPVVEALLREHQQGLSSGEEQPLYEPDADDAEPAIETAARTGHAGERRS